MRMISIIDETHLLCHFVPLENLLMAIHNNQAILTILKDTVIERRLR
jgi:hypothetical protein